MKLFTPGPVNLRPEILKIGGEQQPYFRTKEFSEIVFENEKLLLELVGTKDSKCVPLTASGTGAMDAVVSNLINSEDRVLVVNGGIFGQRWFDICSFYDINFTEFKVGFGKNLDLNLLEQVVEREKITAILVQGTETSSGQAHPIKQIGSIARQKGIFLIVDAITCFLADEYRMDEWSIDVSIISSQKGLALPPGMSFLIMNSQAQQRLNQTKSRSYYFNLKHYLKDLERGQTPFTPAITIINQLHNQLGYIEQIGLDNHLQRINDLAMDFRKKIIDLPVKMVAETPSNCLTALRIDPKANVNPHDLFECLKDEYQIYITPTGGEYAISDFRVSHLGELSFNDNNELVLQLSKYLMVGKSIL